MFRNMDWKTSQMVLFMMLFVGLMSIPMVAEAGFFSRTTRYDVILKNSELVPSVETMNELLASKDPTNKVLVVYLKFVLNKTPDGMYRKLASAEETDSEFLRFIRANKEFCFSAMCVSAVKTLSAPGSTGIEDHLLLAVMQAFTARPITEEEKQEMRSLKHTISGLSTYILVEILREPQRFYDEIKKEFDGVLSAINGQ